MPSAVTATKQGGSSSSCVERLPNMNVTDSESSERSRCFQKPGIVGAKRCNSNKKRQQQVC